MEQILSDEKEIEKRIFTFPNSAIKEQDVKLNYVRFLMSTENKDCIASLQNIGQRINMREIKTIINKTREEGVQEGR